MSMHSSHLLARYIYIFGYLVNQVTAYLVTASIPFQLQELPEIKNKTTRYIVFTCATTASLALLYIALGCQFFGSLTAIDAVFSHMIRFSGFYYTLALAYEQYLDKKAWEKIKAKKQDSIIALGLAGCFLYELIFSFAAGARLKLLAAISCSITTIMHFKEESKWAFVVTVLITQVLRVAIGFIATTGLYTHIWYPTLGYASGCFGLAIGAGMTYLAISYKKIDINILLNKDWSTHSIVQKSINAVLILLILAASLFIATPLWAPLIGSLRVYLSVYMGQTFAVTCAFLLLVSAELFTSMVKKTYSLLLLSRVQNQNNRDSQVLKIIQKTSDLIKGYILLMPATIVAFLYYTQVGIKAKLGYMLAIITPTFILNYLWFTKAPPKWKQWCVDNLIPDILKNHADKDELFSGKKPNQITKFVQLPFALSSLMLFVINTYYYQPEMNAYMLANLHLVANTIATSTLAISVNSFIVFVACKAAQHCSRELFAPMVKKNIPGDYEKEFKNMILSSYISTPAWLLYCCTKLGMSYTWLTIIKATALGAATSLASFAIIVLSYNLLEHYKPDLGKKIKKSKIMPATSLLSIFSFILPYSPVVYLMNTLYHIATLIGQSIFKVPKLQLDNALNKTKLKQKIGKKLADSTVAGKSQQFFKNTSKKHSL